MSNAKSINERPENRALNDMPLTSEIITIGGERDKTRPAAPKLSLLRNGIDKFTPLATTTSTTTVTKPLSLSLAVVQMRKNPFQTYLPTLLSFQPHTTISDK